jgi:Domain of Unknown Function (DUF748)
MALAERLRTINFRGKRDRAGERPIAARYSTAAKIGLWSAGIIAALLLVAVVAAFFIDEPLRRRMESNLNNTLKGYTVRLGKLDFHPIGLSLDLEDATISQNEHPDPPVAHIPNLTASVQWRALLHGRVVAEFAIDNPRIHLNLRQTKNEIEDEVPIEQRGWQQALQEIYPLEINHFVVRGGELTYIDEGPFRPLQLTDVNFRAENIRNVRSEQGVYPSGVHLEAVVFDKGKLVADGYADFLAEPHVSFKTDQLLLEQVELDYFKPILERYNFTASQGSLSVYGNMEYASHSKYINVDEVKLQNLNAEYLHKKSTETPAETASKKVDKTAKEHSDDATLQVRVDRVRINGKLGFLNQAAQPEYRLFVEQTDLQISNFSNQSAAGVMTATLRGKFMGGGNAEMNLNARPNKKGPDLDLKIAIDETDMKPMNDLFRSYGNFDVVGGQFSFYSELSVRNGMIEGYVKPLFKDLNVYDRRQDREKGLFRKLYEGMIGGLSFLLKNPPREEVATTVPISGKLSNPETSTWQAVLGLMQNAFFKAILPGFEREASGGRKSN